MSFNQFLPAKLAYSGCNISVLFNVIGDDGVGDIDVVGEDAVTVDGANAVDEVAVDIDDAAGGDVIKLDENNPLSGQLFTRCLIRLPFCVKVTLHIMHWK